MSSIGTPGSYLVRCMAGADFTCATFGRAGEFVGEEALEGFPVFRDDANDEIGIAGHHVGFAHLRPGVGQLGKIGEIAFGMIGERDEREDRDAIAQFIRRHIGMIAADIIQLLQAPHAAQAGRRRNAHVLGEIHIGDAAVLLQFAQNSQVDAVEFDVLHTGLYERGQTSMIASSANQITCWVVTDGKAGMENQCLGLAEALGLAPAIMRVKLRSPWRELSPFLRHGLRYAFSRAGNNFGPPWPDLLIATGRASIPASLYVRRASRKDGLPSPKRSSGFAQAGARGTLVVQLQNPVIDPAYFDLVVVPRHDGLTGPNVMTTRGALHRVTAEMLAREGEIWRPKLEASAAAAHRRSARRQQCGLSIDAERDENHRPAPGGTG